MLGLVLVLGYLSYLILRPFLAPIAWAVVFSIVFFPVYSFIVKYGKWRSLAAGITVVLVCVLILGPFSYFAYLLTVELSNVSPDTFDFKSIAHLVNHPLITPITGRLLSFFHISQAQLQASTVKVLSDAGKGLVGYLPGRLGDAAGAALHFVLMAFALFFFLRDGPQFLERISLYMPFSKAHREKLTRQVKGIIISTIYGGIIVALVQGLIGSFTFGLLSLHSPILWGLSISMASFLPLVGSAIVWVPTALWLLLKGAVTEGLVVLFVGIFAITLVDNVLRPVLIRGRLRMPLLAIFFSVFGGIQLFGLIGLVMGPLVLGIFISVLDIFKDVERE
jgi:predicted PurR-regulated permease PerM